MNLIPLLDFHSDFYSDFPQGDVRVFIRNGEVWVNGELSTPNIMGKWDSLVGSELEWVLFCRDGRASGTVSNLGFAGGITLDGFKPYNLGYNNPEPPTWVTLLITAYNLTVFEVPDCPLPCVDWFYCAPLMAHRKFEVPPAHPITWDTPFPWVGELASVIEDYDLGGYYISSEGHIYTNDKVMVITYPYYSVQQIADKLRLLKNQGVGV